MERCKDHPAYNAKQPPDNQCKYCKQLWYNREMENFNTDEFDLSPELLELLDQHKEDK